jgi:two-component system response regulator WspF
MKIAIVNDMFMAVEAMRRVISAAGQHHVIWIARDGVEAVEKCAKETPDLILMDLIMPRMDGVQATRQIMAKTPCAIVVVTADIDSSAAKVFEAMGVGALDAVNTPVMDDATNSEGAIALLTKIETIRKLIGVKPGLKKFERAPLPAGKILAHGKLVLFGASAGGPAALAKILSGLPMNFPAPIVVVQHVDAQFAQGLVQWIQSQCSLRILVAQEGDQPQPGTVLVAGRDRHLVFTGPERLGYTRLPTDSSYCPSIDVFFQSAKKHCPHDGVAVLLTGMGRDGAEGLKTLREHHFHTIAQDAASSAVFGMPKAAMELHAADEILPLDKIAPRLANLVQPTIKSR